MTAPDSPVAQTAARMIVELALQEHTPLAEGLFRHPALFEQPAAPAPLASVRAARQLGHELQEQLRLQALRARGHGEEWEEIAAAMDLRHGGRPDASAAYLTALGTRSDDPWWTPARGVLWTCTTCEEVVRDFGPQVGGPEDRESGHATTCSRHTGEQLAWEALWS
ncbi:MAG: hypothetical protein JWM64_975 [Frankiales bacterium]|nr:hypothetical protein [Frankiales bacterium]